MSHTPHETIVCPNCGSIAEKNYCSECGQETHLHNDSFWGLVMHFIGHYFHYDSKFWKTLRALWFSPGKLTTAYWNKQRMRYIPPVSLYIFLSAVFFLSFYLFNWNKSEMIAVLKEEQIEKAQITPEVKRADSLKRMAMYKSWGLKKKRHVSKGVKANFDRIRIIVDDPEKGAEFLEEFIHSFPRIFFFLIPLMALLLKVLFIRRKELLFVQHAIFSIHVHSFCFSLALIFLIPWVQEWLTPVLFLGIFIYLLTAMRSTYNVKWVKAFFYSLIVFIGYTIFTLIAIAVDAVFLMLG